MLQGMEEVEKNIMMMRTMLSGDGETEPIAEHITQLTAEICNEDAISLLFHKLPILGWEVSNYVWFNKATMQIHADLFISKLDKYVNLHAD